MINENLADRILPRLPEIQDWFRKHACSTPPPLYCSVDIRDSGKKIGVVDCNLFPAGFNNLCHKDHQATSKAFHSQFSMIAKRKRLGAPRKILILPESHTENKFYVENLYHLVTILNDAGYETEIGWIQNEENPIPPPEKIEAASGKLLHPKVLQMQNNRLFAGDFEPDLVLLNNDFSGGYPKILDQIEQPILPSHRLGWHSRTKSEHFVYYNRLAAEFCQIIDLDPWHLRVITQSVDNVNFNEQTGTDRVAEAVQQVLDQTRTAYKNHKIEQEPFAFVKSNTGTYGMGIMVVRSGEELLAMNRRTKNKMSVGKNRRLIDSVIIQEGIPTKLVVDEKSAEPVIYMAGAELIGGFLRINSERGNEENLNSRGMTFKPLCLANLEEYFKFERGAPELFELVYGSVARISAIAVGMEFQNILATS